MQHIDKNTFVVAFIAFAISWALQLGSAYNKVIKKEDDTFKWGFYFRKNIVDIVAAFLSVFLLLYLIPNMMDYFGLGSIWFAPMGAICGIFNVQLVKLGKKAFEKKIADKTGETIDDLKSE